MAGTKKDQLSYTAGEKGRNRVRVFRSAKSPMIQMEWRENGKRLTPSLKHGDWEKAKRQADEFAADYVEPELRTEPEPEPEPLTLGELFDIYGEDESPEKAETTQQHDRAALEMFERYFGRDRQAASLTKRDWNRFISDRRGGRVAPAGSTTEGVRNRIIQQDLQLLKAVLNWAVDSGLLPEGNPFVGKRFRLPKEKNPQRVLISEEEYRAVLSVADQVCWRFKGMLVVAHETGHRIGAIRQLRWSDIDFEAMMIKWRAETEKTDYEHETAATRAAIEALREVLAGNPGFGDAPVFPGERDPTQATDRHRPTKWWNKAERLAGLEPKRGRGWHSLRRQFASELMGQPLKVLCELGGWKSYQTLLECYQRPDMSQMREALDDRRRASGGTG